ncbi:hypothetical protein ABZP36_002777 [Zizania latifolia]
MLPALASLPLFAVRFLGEKRLCLWKLLVVVLARRLAHEMRHRSTLATPAHRHHGTHYINHLSGSSAPLLSLETEREERERGATGQEAEQKAKSQRHEREEGGRSKKEREEGGQAIAERRVTAKSRAATRRPRCLPWMEFLRGWIPWLHKETQCSVCREKITRRDCCGERFHQRCLRTCPSCDADLEPRGRGPPRWPPL